MPKIPCHAVLASGIPQYIAAFCYSSMKHLTYLPVWIGFAENQLSIHLIWFHRNTADRKSSASKQTDRFISISISGDKNKAVGSPLVHLTFRGTPILPLGTSDVKPAGTVQQHITGCVLSQTWVTNWITTFTMTLSDCWLLLLAKLFHFLYWTQTESE